jgi:hypothetical protein
MPRLSGPIPEHLLRYLRERLDRRIATLAATEPGLLQRIAQQARQRALQLLGLSELQAEWDAIAVQREGLKQRQWQVHQAMLAVVHRIPLEEAKGSHSLRLPAPVRRALAGAEAACEEELLREHPVGQQILRLRRERAQLAQTLWLAAAPRPLQKLWHRALTLLAEEPTDLQEAVLACSATGSLSSPASSTPAQTGPCSLS